MRRGFAETYFVAAISAAAITSGQNPQAPSYHFSSGSAALEIPAELVANGLVFLRANVNDHPGWFILDNASQGFTLDRDYAREISLQSSGTATARGGGASQIQASIVRDARIGLPGLDLTHRNLVVIPLKMLEPTLGHRVDGIIGSRLFDDFVVAIDYERHRVSIYAHNAHQPSPKDTMLSVFVDSHGFPFIEAKLALPGAVSFGARFLIDGGANTYVDIYKPFADGHHLPPPSMKLLSEPGASTGGTTQAKQGRGEEMSVGPFSVRNPPVEFAQDTEGLMAAKDYAGMIGTQFLRRFTVVFNNPGKRIFLTPNGHYNDVVETDESGLRLHAEGPDFRKFIVVRILPRSPATEARIEPGDVIESIGDRRADQLTLTEFRAMLCRPNARYSIQIARGNNRLRLMLALRTLL